MSNGEYLPPPQSETQKRVERRIFELADDNGKRLGLSRRQFLQTGCGMAAAFLAMNEIYGADVFQVAAAEAREPELMQARAQGLAGQFIFDVQTHFVRDDFDHRELLRLAEFAGEHWNPKLKERASLARPVQVPELRQGGLLRQRHQHGAAERRAVRRSELVVPVQRADRQDARADQRLRRLAAALLAHTVITPKQPGWMEEVDKAIAVYKPDRGRPTPSATRSRPRNIPGGSTTSR